MTLKKHTPSGGIGLNALCKEVNLRVGTVQYWLYVKFKDNVERIPVTADTKRKGYIKCYYKWKKVKENE